jgi:hypothetical protein
MKPMSGAVLAVAAVLTSPALVSAALGDFPLDVALTRYLVAVGVCWALLWVAADLVWTTPAPTPAAQSSPGTSGEPVEPG